MKIINVMARNLSDALNKTKIKNIGECTALINGGSLDEKVRKFIENASKSKDVYNYVIVTNAKYAITTQEWVEVASNIILANSKNAFAFESVEKAQEFALKTKMQDAFIEEQRHKILMTKTVESNIYPKELHKNQTIEVLNEYIFYIEE